MLPGVHVGMRSIGVLIVGHSAVLREQIGDAIRAQSGLRVAGTAADGRHGLELVEQLKPGVVVLDLQMPGFDGLQTLDALLLARPLPTIVLGGAEPSQADAVLTALERGAQDYLLKPESGAAAEANLAGELIRKIRHVVGLDVRRALRLRQDRLVRQKQRAGANLAGAKSSAGTESIPPDYGTACIAVGAALAGACGLTSLLAALRSPMPPLVVAVPMEANLTATLARRLASLTTLEVKEAVDGDELLPNRVLLAPGGKHLQVRRRAGKAVAQVTEFEPVSGNCPSADVLLHSAAETFAARTLGVLLAGPGRDGVAGCAAVKACGGYVVGQDEASSEVYGTNRAAWDEGYVDRPCSLDDLAETLRQFAAERFAGKNST